MTQQYSNRKIQRNNTIEFDRQQKGVLETTHEMLERLEAHLRAIGQFKMHSLYFPIPPLLHQGLPLF